MSLATTDVAIIGRGVAAAAALLALRDSQLRVRVIAPPHRELDRVGETLSPAANDVLRQLGVYDQFIEERHRPAQTTYSAWGTSELVERHGILNPEGTGWHLDRDRFETFLWNCAGEVPFADIADRLDRAKETSDDWHLTCRDSRSVLARFVIDASGRACAFARQQANLFRQDKLVATSSLLNQVDSSVTPTPATLVEALPNGWWYSALRPDRRLVVCAFTDHDLLPAEIPDAAEAWRRWIEQTTWTAKRIESAGYAVTAAPRCASAATVWLDSVADDNWAAAGDAAAAFDPLSSHGLTTALWCGRRAALAAMARLAGDSQPLRDYADAVRQGVTKFQQQHRRVYSLETRFHGEEFWSRR